MKRSTFKPRPSGAQVRARRECFESHKWADNGGKIWLTCYICGGNIDPAREKWEAEHVIRRSLKTDDTPSNVWPAHPACHKPKTAEDIKENSKGKRVSDKHFGITR